MKKTLVMIPTLNSKNHILDVVTDIQLHFPDVDYLVVDRGSDDLTKYILDNNQITRLEFPVEANYFDAVSLGLIYAYQNNYDAFIEYDDENLFNSKDISYLKRTYENKKYDFILTSRFKKKKAKFLRNIGNEIMRKIVKAKIHKNITDPLMRYKLYGKRAIEIFGKEKKNMDNPTPDRIVQLIKKGYTYTEISTELQNNRKHQSKYRGAKYFFTILGWFLSIIFVDPFKNIGGKNE